MKKTCMAIIAAAMLCFAGADSRAAVPPGWDNVQATTLFMGIFGTATLDGVPVAADNASVLAVFAPGVLQPIGVYTFSGVDNTGSFLVTAYGLDNTTVVPKFAAADNDLLSFALYKASSGAVIANPAIVNRGDIFGAPLAYADNTTVRYVLNGGLPSVLDNVTLAFTTPPANSESDGWFKKAFGCSAAGGRGPDPLEGALTLLLMVAPALWLRTRSRRNRQGN